MQPAGDERRRDLVRIFTAAIGAVDPACLVRSHIERRAGRWAVEGDGRQLASWGNRVLIVGAGKAGARMAAGVEEAVGPGGAGGMVIVPDGCEVPLRDVQVECAQHPIPDQRGMRATERLCRLLQRSPRGPVLCLVSGGASSLLVRPRPPVTLPEKVETTRLLLACGADIEAVNAVRKHLSEVKGGGLLRLARGRPLATLVLSDVIGDDPSVVGSGPSAPDQTTYAEAEEVLRAAGVLLDVPVSVRKLLQRGVRGQLPETVRPDDPAVEGCAALVVGSNRNALSAAAEEAARLGYVPIVQAVPIHGDTAQSARNWLRWVENEMAKQPGRHCCAIAGGETTMEVRGSGRGGRNQQFALELAEALASGSIAILSAGTDGVDGPTDAAGAFAGRETLAKARRASLDPQAALRSNDAYTFFDAIGDLFRCGPTGTNVMDLKLAVC